MTVERGQMLGRYEIVGLLGAGGMGEVYRARDHELDREVAVKILPEGAWEDTKRLERFEREAKIVAGLSHPNILPLFDFGREGQVVFIVSELLEGKTLREHLSARKKLLPLEDAIDIATAAAAGLGAAHANGIVHRDIKPENILLTKDRTLKILDFGVARQSPSDPGTGIPDVSESTLTGPGTLIGTTGYMSPEQLRGQTVDARSDVFSLGCVVYEMITGERAFAGKTAADRMTAVLRTDPTPPSSIRNNLPTAIDQIVSRCLAKDPNERFESARDVAFALEAISTDRPQQPMDAPSFSWWPQGRTRSLEIEDEIGNLASFQSLPVIETARLLELNLEAAAFEELRLQETNVTASFVPFVEGTGILVLANNQEEVLSAIEHLQEAIKHDPALAPAQTELARASLRAFRDSQDTAWINRGIAAAATALTGRGSSIDAALVLSSTNGRACRRKHRDPC